MGNCPSKTKEKKMVAFFRAFGVVLMVIGAGAVGASVEPSPSTSVEWIVGVAVMGFILIVVGNNLRVAAGGRPLADF